MAESCQHEHFEAEVEVDRVWSGRREGRGDLLFMATVRIRCTRCRTRFAFPGPGMGLSWRMPKVDATRLELRAPIVPDGHMTSMMADVPGFGMRGPKEGS